MKLIYAVRSQGHCALGRRLGSDWNGTRVGLLGAGNVLFRDMGDHLTVVQFVKISTMPYSVF